MHHRLVITILVNLLERLYIAFRSKRLSQGGKQLNIVCSYPNYIDSYTKS